MQVTENTRNVFFKKKEKKKTKNPLHCGLEAALKAPKTYNTTHNRENVK